METILVWLMMGIETGKFSEDFHVSPHDTKELCVAEAEREGWADWSCVPVLMPKGQGMVIVNDFDNDQMCSVPTGETDWFGHPKTEWVVCPGEQY
jgi:hypothetical protein